MKRVSKPVVFIVATLIVCFAYLSFFGVSTTFGDIKTTYIKGAGDIRFGIDIRGGVEVTFVPDTTEPVTDEQMSSAEAVIKLRLLSQNITDSEVYTDYDNNRIIVRFPWKEDETEFDPAAAIEELGATALLTFREGFEVDADGAPTGVTKDTVIIQGADIEKAETIVIQDPNTMLTSYAVELTLKESGKQAFADATKRLGGEIISIWMDDVCISNPVVNKDEPITDGIACITGDFTADAANALADRINAGALPFKLNSQNFNSINATLGAGALQAMVLAGIIAFVVVCLIMIFVFRLPGLIASIALLGQAAGSIAAISGFFPGIPSFTLTLPGIAGIILSIGMGVDANVITSERIREELAKGRTLEKAIDIGFSKAFGAVLDGNITVLIVSVILMGAFGDPNSIFAWIAKFFTFLFGASTSGVIYSFGYTLFVGVICNLVMGVGATRLMLKSISKFKPFRKLWLYGGKK